MYPDLLPVEISRNVRGSDRLFVGGSHPAHDFLEALYEGGMLNEEEDIEVDTSLTQGMKGTVRTDEFVVLSGQ